MTSLAKSEGTEKRKRGRPAGLHKRHGSSGNVPRNESVASLSSDTDRASVFGVGSGIGSNATTMSNLGLSSLGLGLSAGLFRRSRRYRPPDPHRELLVIMPGEDPAMILGIPSHELDEFVISFNEPIDYEEEPPEPWKSIHPKTFVFYWISRVS